MKTLNLKRTLFLAIAVFVAIVVVLTVKEAVYVINTYHVSWSRLIN